MPANIVHIKRHEIPGRVSVTTAAGGLTKLVVTAAAGTAEIYPHGAHITHFQKHGEPPLIFLSRQSAFAPGKAIRGGVPICFPWFGNRDGQPSHGFARTTEWQLVKTSATPAGAVILQFALPQLPAQPSWQNLRTEFTVTVADSLTMELTAANESCDESVEFETCLHTYLHVGDIAAVSIAGLQHASYLDNAGDGHGARKQQTEDPLRISRETNRLYLNTAAAVEVRDDSLKRSIRVDKTGSESTVVWNPWTTQKLPDDFDPAEYRTMVCVESGNIKENRIVLAPGKSSALKVVLSSRGN
jgi:D-hexose-6-phosphate mutarotase